MCKRTKNPRKYSYTYFNAEGLKRKVDNPHFLEFIQNFTIATIMETWKPGSQNQQKQLYRGVI